MQLKWATFMGGYHMETIVFDMTYSVDNYRDRQGKISWVVIGREDHKILKTGYQTKEEAMVAAHQIIEKELEKGYIGKECFPDRFTAKLSYIHEDMFGCKKALALFTNENGDEYIDSALISATIPKGSLVREVDPEHHDSLPYKFGICRKCRSDRAVIGDILEPMFLRPGESTNLPSRKTQRKKIPIISVHVITEALRMYVIAQGDLYVYTSRRMATYRDECTIMRKLIAGFMNTILGPNTNARIFGEWVSKITEPRFPVPFDLIMVNKVLDPYKDVADRYQDNSYMLCKVLLARILRDIGIMDIALRQSYKIGDNIQIDNFDLSNEACGAGFHFFKTALEAWNYKFN